MREVKDSGIEWIGEIPAHWKTERLQWHITEIKESNKPEKSRQVLSLTNKRGVIPYEEKGAQGNVAKEDYSQYKLAYPGTIVANSMNILIGSVGRCDYFGCVSPVYYVYKPNEGENLEFISYLFQMEQFQKELRRYANGILEIRLRVSSDGILKRELPFPPAHEQSLIVSALNGKLAQVDSLIEIIQTQIDRLNDYRTSVISNHTNDTGFRHLKLKRVVNNVEQGWSPSPTERKDDSGWQVLTLAAVKFGRFNAENTKPVEGNIERCKPLLINTGDFLLTRSNTKELVGQVCIVNRPMQNTIFSDLIYRLDLDTRYVYPEFMLYYFQSTQMRQQIQRDAHGSSSTMVKITHKDIDNWEIDLPDMDKQIKIAAQLNDITKKIDDLITIKRKKIDKLEQYKKSLIYEYVTGKKEVS